MKRKVAKISAAALAGASCMMISHPQSADAALTIVANRTAAQVFSNGTYDVITFQLTNMTGPDATTGTISGKTANAEVLGLSGTFNVSGGVGTPQMAFIGTVGGTQEPNTFATSTFEATSSPLNSTAPHNSYLAFKGDASNFTATQVLAGGAKKGTASSVTDSWFTTPSAPTTSAPNAGNSIGNAGGVEPGHDNLNLTLQDNPSSGDPYAVNGQLAEILVNPGANVAFNGQYSDFGFTSGNATTFTSAGVVTTSPGITGSNKIISLVTGSAPTGTAPNGYGTQSLGTLDVHTGGVSAINIAGGATSGFVAVTGMPGTAAPEYYAIQVALNGVVLAPNDTRLATIIADIQGNDSNIASGVTTVAGSAFAGLFPNYDILIPTSLGASSPYFAFDFSSSASDLTDTDAALGPVTVTGIAAVPEPATAAGVILGAAGLLLGRRKNRVASA